MAKEDVLKSIEENFSSGGNVKVYLNHRTPLYGRFVKHEDHDHLMSRDLIRFISVSRMDHYNEYKSITDTRIYCLSEIYLIKKVDYVTV